MAEFLYSNIAMKIEETMRDLPDGTKLPSEREMAVHYGVSRNVIREALRLLCEKGVLVSQPCRGVYVANQSTEKLANCLEDLLQDHQSPLTDIVEVRETLELSIVEKAIERATEQDIQELINIYQKMENANDRIHEFAELDRAFHIRLAQCTQNPVYTILINAFFQLTDEKLFLLTQMFPTRINSAQREHRKLIEAIQSKDRESALVTARKHFNVNDIMSGALKELARQKAAVHAG